MGYLNVYISLLQMKCSDGYHIVQKFDGMFLMHDTSAIYIYLIVRSSWNSWQTIVGADPGFSERGLNIEVISEAGGHSPPEAIGCFSNIIPKSCLIQDLEHI